MECAGLSNERTTLTLTLINLINQSSQHVSIEVQHGYKFL
jgi:hypothetical protein